MTTHNFVNVQSCDNYTSFSVDQGASVTLADDNTNNLEGTNCLSIKAGGSPQLIEVGANVTNFYIKQNNFVGWCYYAKGKTAQFITDSESGLRIRCYFGGTNPASTPYAEWDQGGNISLPFGWFPCYASGTTASRVGNGHNGTTDYDLLVQRVSIIIDQANDNSGSSDPPFYTDYWHAGTKIQLTGGTPSVPLDQDDIISYDASNSLGVVVEDKSQKGLILRCGIDVGDGTTAGYLKLVDLAILNDQLSDEVEQEWNVLNGCTLILGELETGTDSTYAVSGCQLSCPPTRNPNFNILNGGDVEIYDSFFYQWGELNIGEALGGAGTRTMRLVDIDACESINLNQVGSYTELEIHDNAQRVQQHCGEILESPSAFSALVHNNAEGFHFRGNVTVPNYVALDNTTYDLRVLEGITATLINSTYDYNKIARQAA